MENQDLNKKVSHSQDHDYNSKENSRVTKQDPQQEKRTQPGSREEEKFENQSTKNVSGYSSRS